MGDRGLLRLEWDGVGNRDIDGLLRGVRAVSGARLARDNDHEAVGFAKNGAGDLEDPKTLNPKTLNPKTLKP